LFSVQIFQTALSWLKWYWKKIFFKSFFLFNIFRMEAKHFSWVKCGWMSIKQDTKRIGEFFNWLKIEKEYEKHSNYKINYGWRLWARASKWSESTCTGNRQHNRQFFWMFIVTWISSTISFLILPFSITTYFWLLSKHHSSFWVLLRYLIKFS